MSSHRPWHRTPLVFAACGVGLLLLCVAMVLIASAVVVRIWRLVHRIRS
ncbi:hypothetical protein [Brevibacterium aurantiacum]|nr:hypothetical protein [Brevibacterium aurantiacum]